MSMSMPPAAFGVICQPVQRPGHIRLPDLSGVVHHPHGQHLRAGCRQPEQPGDERGMARVTAVVRAGEPRRRRLIVVQLRSMPAVLLRGIEQERRAAGRVRQPVVLLHAAVQQRDHRRPGCRRLAGLRPRRWIRHVVRRSREPCDGPVPALLPAGEELGVPRAVVDGAGAVLRFLVGHGHVCLHVRDRAAGGGCRQETGGRATRPDTSISRSRLAPAGCSWHR